MKNIKIVQEFTYEKITYGLGENGKVYAHGPYGKRWDSNLKQSKYKFNDVGILKMIADNFYSSYCLLKII